MLISPEGEKLAKRIPLTEHPTPQFQRKNFEVLNGEWDFAITKSADLPTSYDSKILVPFAPETYLSGIHKRIGADDYLHYRRVIKVPRRRKKSKTLIHFGAVDQICDVFLNGLHMCHHEGGYLPFTVDCDVLPNEENVLQVVVQDDTDSDVFPRGKQVNKPGGVWYTPTSGIWQTVWMEQVPFAYLDSLRITPDFDRKKVLIHATYHGKNTPIMVKCSNKGKLIAQGVTDSHGNVTLSLAKDFNPWSPSKPFLYDLEVSYGEDVVYSYFAMRKISSVDFNGHKVFALNNKPLFLTGVLDQGYFPESGLTPPSDRAMIDDIKMVKDLGYNMIRKHIKIEPMRWYYHCDRMGMIVIQDFVNGGAKYKNRYIVLRPLFKFDKDDSKPADIKKLGRGNPKSQARFIADLGETVDLLYNCPCIAIWTLFNEGWGQFRTKEVLPLLQAQDATRLVDANSGWFDQGVGDFNSDHIYFKNIANMKSDGKRILSLSEYGGMGLKVEGHAWAKTAFSYKSFKDEEKLNDAIRKLYEEKLLPMKEKEGLSVAVYTQISDVEEELNGLITYDRKHLKVDKKIIKECNLLLINGKTNG